jgi:DNA-directed RNA polymerase subunit M/transcription elongation factor TFIIS
MVENAAPRRTCVECGASDIIEIDMTLGDGTTVLFCSCHECENRWWNRDGEPLGLDAVLRLARPDE